MLRSKLQNKLINLECEKTGKKSKSREINVSLSWKDLKEITSII